MVDQKMTGRTFLAHPIYVYTKINVVVPPYARKVLAMCFD